MAEVFGGLTLPHCDINSARAVVVPVPYDLTSTWKKGADRGPEAIIAASSQIELYDIETESEPYLKGIATEDAVLCEDGPEVLAGLVKSKVSEVVGRGQLPVLLGGEHSVSIGAIQAVAEAFDDVTVLQIDAHGDTRESYEGSKYNHACVMARARECAKVMQVGIRAIDESEVAGMERDRVVYAHEIMGAHADEQWVERVLGKLTKRVYITVDLDGFDSSVVPATGTPEPGGLGWYEVNHLIGEVTKRCEVVGMDVVELLPTPGHWASEFLAAKLVYRMLAMIFDSSGK